MPGEGIIFQPPGINHKSKHTVENWHQNLTDIIAFNTADGFLVTRMQDIVFCEARGSYTIVLVQGQPEILVCRNLGTMEETLPDSLFLRVHHKYLVNKLHVRRFSANGELTLQMSNGKKVEVSTRKKQVVTEAFIRL